MTIPSTPRRAGPFVGTGSLVSYAFTFKVFSKTDVAVVIADADGNESTLVIDSSVLVTVNPDQVALPGGSVQYAVAGVATALPAGYSLAILSANEYKQGTQLPSGGNYRAEVVEQGMDALAVLIQQQQEVLARALVFSPTDAAGSTLPPAANRADRLLGFDSDGRVIAVAPAGGSAAALAGDLASTSNATKNAGQVGFSYALNYAANTIGWAARTALNKPNALRWVPVSEWANILNGTSTTDLTAYIQTAVNNSAFFPQGRWNINATTGITLTDGVDVSGAGKARTIFWAILNTGGTMANLVAYGAGSVFKRQFNVAPGTNAYITNVRLSDFAVILNHPPSGSITTTAIQIGIDLRNITRSIVERVHVGNVAPLGSIVAKADPGSYAAQGYGIVLGNVTQAASSYCGGEVNTVRDCHVWGAYKGIVLDDLTLSPGSSVHATVIENCDVQACHHLLVQEQQYTAGFEWLNNVLQNVITQPGGGGGTRYVMRVAGYNSYVKAGYIEAGSTDYLLRLDSTASSNRVVMSHYGATVIGTATFSDAGRRNEVRAFIDTGANVGGVDSLGAPVTRYDRAYQSVWCKFHWSGSAIVVDGGFGVTITRPSGAGDYLATFDLPFIDANSYTIELSADTNASSHGATFAVISQSANNYRFQCYAQNGGTSTAIDPRFVFVRFTQAQ